jgi:hypothetical protein
MNAQKEHRFNLRPGPKAVDNALQGAELASRAFDPESRQAIALAVSELAENLLKYGDASQPGAIVITSEGDHVRVRATNPKSSRDDARYVADLLKRLTTADPKELYRARLKELFKNPQLKRAQLGLLRLAFEGNFRLSSTFTPPCLEIVAERRCREQS